MFSCFRIRILAYVAPHFLGFAMLAQAPAAQTASAPSAPWTPSPAHVNAPLGDVPRMPGDGLGAFKTHQYRDLFAEQGHAANESRAKIEKAYNQLFHGDGQEERIYLKPARMKTAHSPTLPIGQTMTRAPRE